MAVGYIVSMSRNGGLDIGVVRNLYWEALLWWALLTPEWSLRCKLPNQGSVQKIRNFGAIFNVFWRILQGEGVLSLLPPGYDDGPRSLYVVLPVTDW